MIGKFYIAIDNNLKEKGGRPDNVYRFIEGVANSKQQPDKPMVYGKDHHQSEVKDMTLQLKQCTRQLEELNSECVELKARFKTSRDQLEASKLTLRDITNEKMHLKKRCDISKHKIERLKDQHTSLKEEFVKLQLENLDLVSDEEDLNDEAGNSDFNFLSTCDAHKATVLSSHSANGRGIFLNTDGTTKRQKKLGGVVASDMVLSVNELSDKCCN